MTRCSRLWEAEAVRDGRLTGAEARSFERHAGGCAACSRQIAALDQLGASLRALPPPARDALTVRRTRRTILQRLDEQALRPERPRLARPVGWVAGLVFAFALGLWLRVPTAPSALLTREPEGSTSPRAPASLALATTPAPSSSTAPSPLLAALSPSAAVAPLSPAPAPLLPSPVIPLASPARVSPAIPAPASASLPSPPVSASPAASPGPAGLASLAPSAPAAPPPPPAAPSEEAHASEFEQAMEHFRAGRLASASALFEIFVRAHPGDARAEDAAYLRVVALARGGQRDAARQAAASYLARYPAGLRAKEVQSLAR